MKTLIVLLSINVLFAACASVPPAQPNLDVDTDADQPTTTPKKCQEFCTLDYSPVCGYDGTCYKEYANKCVYDLEKCSKRNSLETVDTSLCDLAAKDNHPNFKIC